MTREQFLARVSRLILAAETTDGPALVRMLEVNCLGPAERGGAVNEPPVPPVYTFIDTMPAFAAREAATEEVLTLLRSDTPTRYISAVKLFRERVLGCGLLEAKNAVDALLVKHGIARRPSPDAPIGGICRAMDCTGECVPFYRDNPNLGYLPIGYRCSSCGQMYSATMAALPR